jgi:hypothetical protein
VPEPEHATIALLYGIQPLIVPVTITYTPNPNYDQEYERWDAAGRAQKAAWEREGRTSATVVALVVMGALCSGLFLLRRLLSLGAVSGLLCAVGVVFVMANIRVLGSAASQYLVEFGAALAALGLAGMLAWLVRAAWVRISARPSHRGAER